MTHPRRFVQCDVFSSIPMRGNALAVVIDGDGIDEDSMRAFAAWTNLAETTFLLSPTDAVADYWVRIFTPSREMPFAGHPTLGSCMAWLHAGGEPKDAGVVRQECGVGIVEIDVSGKLPAFVAPPTRIGSLPDDAFEAMVEALDIERARVVGTALLDNGPVWQIIELDSADAVLAVDSSRVRWPQFTPIGLLGRQPVGHETDFEVGMLAPSSGMSEDPITGSLNSALAHWLQMNGRLDRDLVMAQGTSIGRAGRVSLVPDRANTTRVRVGGAVQILIEGTLTF